MCLRPQCQARLRSTPRPPSPHRIAALRRIDEIEVPLVGLGQAPDDLIEPLAG